MSILEDLFQLPNLDLITGKSRFFSDPLLTTLSNTNCSRTELASCRDDSVALRLKTIAIASILIAGISGIWIPLIGKNNHFLRTESNHFFATKAFAAGVILATGFVHMLPDGSKALSSPCLAGSIWAKFPFSGFIAMVASLLTLVMDFIGIQYYERKNDPGRVDIVESEPGLGVNNVERIEEGVSKVCSDRMNNFPQAGCDLNLNGHSHGHSHEFEVGDAEGSIRHVVVSQILEVGILSHSIIIGFSLGVSQSPCTIRPLIAALSFHQFFEGFALGGCMSQARFKTLSTALMSCFFAITTPLGIAIGIFVSKFYNPNSPRGLVVEGIFDSLSAGILVYMALVDLISADFLSKRMRSNVRLQLVSYLALFVGAGLMSSLAIWV